MIDLTNLQGGCLSSVERILPADEYKARWDKARKFMAEKDIAALFITEPLNNMYFAGAQTRMMGARSSFFILPIDHDPIQLVHVFYERGIKRQTPVDVRSYQTLLGFPYDNKIKEVIDELRLSRSRIGAELGYEQRLAIPYNDFIKIENSLPAAKFVDASEIIWALRMVKSKAEVECIRKAVDISCKAFVNVLKTAKEGVKENEVSSIFVQEQMRLGGGTPYASVDGIARDRAIKKGDLLWYDFGCTYKGYWSDLSGGIVIGKSTEKQKKMQRIVVKVTGAVIEAVKPGMKASDVSIICDKEFKKAGLSEIWGVGDCASPSSNMACRIGHGVGLFLTENPHIAKYDHTVLKPGMVITVEPGIHTDYGHFHAEEDLLITEDGYEILSKIPRELVI